MRYEKLVKNTLRAGALALTTLSHSPAQAHDWDPTVIPTIGSGESVHPKPSEPSRMDVYGAVEYCERFKKRCALHSAPSTFAEANDFSLVELQQVQQEINFAITPISDKKNYGVEEYWAIADKKGDCEDIALRKRDELMKQGWPEGNLLMTVVRDEKNEGHAVLTVVTDNGDYILDNKSEKIMTLEQMIRRGYTLVMRQSRSDPKVWYSLEQPTGSLLSVGEHLATK
jgi:predicted transglutaminase-like cysteine proteinase